MLQDPGWSRLVLATGVSHEKYFHIIWSKIFVLHYFRYSLQVIGKFSIRIVPDQTPEEVMKLTTEYLERKWSERKTPNKMKVWGDGDRGWLGDTNSLNFQAGIRCRGPLCIVLIVVVTPPIV